MVVKKIAIINDQPHHSGTGTYAWHLADLLTKSSEHTIDHLFLDYKEGRVVRNPGLPGQTEIGVLPQYPIIDNRPFFWSRALRLIKGYDLYHFTSQNMSFLVSKVPAAAVVTCLDIIPYLNPEKLLEKYWRAYLYSGLKNAAGIAAISEFTKTDLINHFDIGQERIKVTYLGVGSEFTPRDKNETRKKLALPEDKKIILHVGTAAARKRINLLVESFSLIKDGRAVLLRLGKSTREHRELCLKRGVADRVKFIDNVSKDELPLFYSAADLLVFPSSYEGFGLPPLEAMASGCPVLAANNSSIPEVTGEAAILIDSDDPAAWAASIDRILSDEELRARMKRNGLKRAERFSWQNTADMTLKFYNSILMNNHG